MELKEIERGCNFIAVGLKGRLDINGVQAVEMQLSKEASESANLLLDLSEVDFIASLGMRMLLSIAKKLGATHCKLILIAPQQLVREALETAGLFHVMVCVDDWVAAKAAL